MSVKNPKEVLREMLFRKADLEVVVLMRSPS